MAMDIRCYHDMVFYAASVDVMQRFRLGEMSSLGLTSIMDAAIALAAVLASIVILGRIAVHLRLPLASARGGGRLAVKASIAVDPKRRLTIVACDGRESLLLLGPHGDLVVGSLDAPSDRAP